MELSPICHRSNVVERGGETSQLFSAVLTFVPVPLVDFQSIFANVVVVGFRVICCPRGGFFVSRLTSNLDKR